MPIINIDFFGECVIIILMKNIKINLSDSKTKHSQGFTLIELLVVIAIIGLLSSVALIAMISARQKSRDAKRIGDMTQMNTALELYFATYKGYPSDVSGIPQNMSPTFLVTLPNSPNPPDGTCGSLTHPSPVPGGIPANRYYYYPSGTTYVIGTNTVYPDYGYYFCLGDKTGNFDAGPHILTPKGVR